MHEQTKSLDIEKKEPVKYLDALDEERFVRIFLISNPFSSSRIDISYLKLCIMLLVAMYLMTN